MTKLASVADIKFHAARLRLPEIWIELPGLVDIGNGSPKHVRADVAGTQPLGHELPIRALGKEVTEVDHNRNAGKLPRFDGAVDGSPVCTLVVSGLDAHDDILVLLRQPGNFLRLHVVLVLLRKIVDHTEPDNIDQRQNPRARPVNHRVAKVFKVAPAGGSGVDHRRDPGSKTEGIRRNAAVPGPDPCQPRSIEEVRVKIDKPGRDIEPFEVDGLSGESSLQVRRNGGYLAVEYRKVHALVDVVLGVDKMTPFEQKVELCQRWNRPEPAKQEQCCFSYH